MNDGQRKVIDSQFETNLDELLKDGDSVSFQPFGQSDGSNGIAIKVAAKWNPGGLTVFEGTTKAEALSKALQYKKEFSQMVPFKEVGIGELFSIKENDLTVDCLKIAASKYFVFNTGKLVISTVDVVEHLNTLPATIKFISVKA